MVKYTYDTWGKVLSVTDANGTLITDTNHIGHRNPIRYRGYYYDIETGLYYLQSRYYDPEVGRFISADEYISTGQGLIGFNMFAYCGNNPVARKDRNGNLWTSIIKNDEDQEFHHMIHTQREKIRRFYIALQVRQLT